MNNLLTTTKLITAKLVAITFIATVIVMMTPESAFAIVGGTEAEAGEQNWMVAIALADESNGYYAQFCGGTLIDPEWVLTAAHCTIDEHNKLFDASDLDVIVGRTTLSSNRGQRIAVTQIIVHTGFDLRMYNNDIALLRLATPVKNAEILPLVSKKSVASDTAAYGWGITENGNGADVLKTAELPVVSERTCKNAYRSYGVKLSKNMVCAGVSAGGTDSCVGDSGGPLVGYENGEAVQVGVVSFGLECGAAGLYGVYTNVANYSGWVAFQMSFRK